MTPVRGERDARGPDGRSTPVAAIQSVIYLLVGIATGVGIASGVGGALVLLVLSVLIAFGFAGVGTLLALRFGSGEAVQAMFPLLFVTLFSTHPRCPATC